MECEPAGEGEVALHRQAVDDVERSERDPGLRQLVAHAGLRGPRAAPQQVVDGPLRLARSARLGDRDVERALVVEEHEKRVRARGRQAGHEPGRELGGGVGGGAGGRDGQGGDEGQDEDTYSHEGSFERRSHLGSTARWSFCQQRGAQSLEC